MLCCSCSGMPPVCDQRRHGAPVIARVICDIFLPKDVWVGCPYFAMLIHLSLIKLCSIDVGHHHCPDAQPLRHVKRWPSVSPTAIDRICRHLAEHSVRARTDLAPGAAARSQGMAPRRRECHVDNVPPLQCGAWSDAAVLCACRCRCTLKCRITIRAWTGSAAAQWLSRVCVCGRQTVSQGTTYLPDSEPAPLRQLCALLLPPAPRLPLQFLACSSLPRLQRC